MKIELVSKSPNYLKTIWPAAKTCYSPMSPIELFLQDPQEDEMMRLVNHILLYF